MTSLVDRIAHFIDRHEMFRPGDRVGVAVSGGSDSVFLLHALRELAPRWNLELSVVHIEHGIRGEASVDDAEFVSKLAGELGLPFHLHRADVPALMDNLEQAARGVRIEFYRELLQSSRLDRIATGHTRSDQAETVLYRLMRGSGLAGLAGILPITEPGLVRPLLELTRPEIQYWLCQRSIVWREDQTNQDRSYARNRLRHDVLPMLAESFNPRLEEALANLATLAKDEERYWEAEIDRLQPAIHEPLVIPVSTLTCVPAAVARRLIRRLIQTLKGDLRQIEFAHVERILGMAQSTEGHDRVQIPGPRHLPVLRMASFFKTRPESHRARLLPPPPRPRIRGTARLLNPYHIAGAGETGARQTLCYIGE